jgi:O-6-methylguanine DNA methyltransferase
MTDHDATFVPPALLDDLHHLAAAPAPPALALNVLIALGLVDNYWEQPTPIGTVWIAHNKHGIAAVHLGESAAEFEAYFRQRFGRHATPNPTPNPKLVQAVQRRLAGERIKLNFDLRGLSEFEHAVLVKALSIPRGETRPYAWIAREIARPNAVRAVGTALGNNPIPLLIPCHRVVRSDGQLGEYALGTDRKRTLLETEGLDLGLSAVLLERGVRYYGSDTTRIFCYPTCRHARRVNVSRHLVTFRSEAEARAAGYRPCKVCRPA